MTEHSRPGRPDRPPIDETYGGQAVIEGVMMRDRRAMCVAVRSPGGEIVLRRDRLGTGRGLLTKLPLVRGMVALVDSVGLGIQALLWSAQAAGEEEEKLTGWQVTVTLGLALVLAVGLFVLLPTVLVSPLRGLARGGAGTGSYAMAALLTLAEGLVRAVVLVVYIVAIARLPDVARVLEYHGAEHRVINASEAGRELSVSAVRGFPVTHVRCGTSFLLYVVLVSVIVFSCFGWPELWRRMAIRLALLPLVAGISYEWIRLAGRSSSPVVQVLSAPGIWLQRLTTREPDDSQAEVAIAALRGLLDGGPAEGVWQ